MLRKTFITLLCLSYLSWSAEPSVDMNEGASTVKSNSEPRQETTNESESNIWTSPWTWGGVILTTSAVVLTIILLEEDPETKRVNQKISGG